MKKFVAGLLCGIMVMSSTFVFAEQIEAIFGQVKLVVDGKPVDKETLLYNDTTYVPLRAVGEALGEEVNYDDSIKTAYIGAMPAGVPKPAPTTAPTPVPTQTPTDKNYASLPGVPDFGAHFGRPLAESYNNDGTYSYGYDASDVDPSDITAYNQLLADNGFEYYSADVPDDGIMTYVSDKYALVLGLSEDAKFLVVTVIELHEQLQ